MILESNISFTTIKYWMVIFVWAHSSIQNEHLGDRPNEVSTPKYIKKKLQNNIGQPSTENAMINRYGCWYFKNF